MHQKQSRFKFFYQSNLPFCGLLRNLSHMFYESILPIELAERMKNGESINLIDVREPYEHEIAKIDEAKLLPLSKFNDWIGDLKPENEVIVMCHHGIRSANLCMFLLRNGFESVFNLEGGIDLWSKEVDPGVPRY
jgi:rhodanese-related sulfurtransferase